MKIHEMGLAPHVQTNAEALEKEFGGVIVWRSGYRDLYPQAKAMAANVRLNRQWIRQTYTRTSRPSFGIALRLQAWVDAHPEQTDEKTLADALHAELLVIPHGRLISKHSYMIGAAPASLAFDLEPIEHDDQLTAMGQEVWHRILTLPYLDPPPMRREGGLRRWHVQFMPIETSVTV
jgi:hypothetical protein